MIVYKRGNILDDDACWIVNPVDCTGVMGAGLAKQFRIKYPKNYLEYKAFCDRTDRGRITGGYVMLTKCEDRHIINFATKEHWSQPSKLEYIKLGLTVMEMMLPRNVKSIAFPKLGCGLGGLKWADVKPLLEKFAATCSHVEVRVYI